MTTTPARGMRDFLPDEVRRRQYVIGVIADVYQRYGFEPLETPAVENIETLLGKYGDEGDKLIFKILKRGEHGRTGDTDLALRYDLTVPLCRVIAEYEAKLPKFFKRYQVQPVWRADRPQRGRFREFYQCDVDAIGSNSPVVEAELLAAASDVFRRLGFADFSIKLNDRRLLNAVIQHAGISSELQETVVRILDQVDKIGAAEATEKMDEAGVGLLEGANLRILLFGLEKQLQGLTGPQRNEKAFDEVQKFFAGNAQALAELDSMRRLVALCESTSAKHHVRFDPALARGLSYYTGAIFEISVPDLAGSLGGGGRYNNLIGVFLGKQIPACGISLGLERILVVMGERGMFPPELTSTAADVMLTIWNEARMADTLALAAELRSAGVRVDVYPEADRLGKQFKYASSRGVPFVLVVGDDEVARGEVAVKNLATGEQTAVARDAAADFVRKHRPA